MSRWPPCVFPEQPSPSGVVKCSLNWTNDTVETFIDIKPFQKYLTTWPKAYILWESPSLMRQLIVRISKLHWEPSELLWKGSPGPLPKSPVKKGSPWQLRGLCDWQLCLLILDLRTTSQGAGVWEAEAESDEADGALREKLMRQSSEVPLPWPSQAWWEVFWFAFLQGSVPTRLHL